MATTELPTKVDPGTTPAGATPEEHGVTHTPTTIYAPLFGKHSSVPTLRLVRTPRYVRFLARCLLTVFLLTPVILMFVPWQQTITGSGRVMDFDPVNRQQTVEAPIKGRIHKWHVQEGSPVKKNQLIVEIRDPDPQKLPRLERQLANLVEKLEKGKEKVKEINRYIESLKEKRDAALEVVASKIEKAKQDVLAAKQTKVDYEAVVKQLRLDVARQTELNEKGLASDLKLQQVTQKYQSAMAKVKMAEAKIEGARKELAAVTKTRSAKTKEIAADIQKARSDLRGAESAVSAYEKDVEEQRIKVAQQETMQVRAPCDGTIHRLLANSSEGGTVVKEGAKLAEIVPKLRRPVVELYIDGNDAPLIPALMRAREEHNQDEPIYVRLQFEGWPAVQFAGWPSVAVGTFGGKVMFVDPTDDGQNRFRILVEPLDPSEDDQPWPDPELLRPGVRANGWVMLNRVPLGYEVWRRMNGFPPVVAPKAPKNKVKRKGKK